jgi:starch synthase
VHCNDWQSGLAPAYLAHAAGARAATVMTLHNLAYQGLFPRGSLEALGLPASAFVPDGLEFYGKLSFLKAGIYYADLITTVSPGYAREIQTPELGFGLDGLLRARVADLVGILNGIDTALWDPARDPLIAQRYDAEWL